MRKAAIYARFSDKVQKETSIDDQVDQCREHARKHGYIVLEDHIYADRAEKGYSTERKQLKALLEAAKRKEFDIVLVDDLSRLARHTRYMLEVMDDLLFWDVEVESVADQLNSGDEENEAYIQFVGVVNQMRTSELRKKTLRGLLGQWDRGYATGGRYYGYDSQPAGEIRINKHGEQCPDGYIHVIKAKEAEVVLRMFKMYADHMSQWAIARTLNEEGVPSARGKGWNAATIGKRLSDTRYIGIWVYRRRRTRRDHKRNRTRYIELPESEHHVRIQEDLRIVPQDLWVQVQQIREDTRRRRGIEPGKKGFSRNQRGTQRGSSAHLLAGILECSECGLGITLEGGKGGRGAGYYGCRRGQKNGTCSNKVLVPRQRTERILLGKVMEILSDPEQVRDVLARVEVEIQKLYADIPEKLQLEETELKENESRLSNLVESIARGRDSKAVSDAIVLTERRVEQLRAEVSVMRKNRDRVFRTPPLEWVEARLSNIKSVLEERSCKSSRVLKDLLGRAVMTPVYPDIGRPYYEVTTSLGTLALLEPPPDGSGGGQGFANARIVSPQGFEPRTLRLRVSSSTRLSYGP